MRDDPALLVGRGLVLDALRNDEELALGELDVAVAQAHAHPALDDEEELVLGLVVMPDEFALEFDDLDLVVVQVSDDLRAAAVSSKSRTFGRLTLFMVTSFLSIGLVPRPTCGGVRLAAGVTSVPAPGCPGARAAEDISVRKIRADGEPAVPDGGVRFLDDRLAVVEVVEAPGPARTRAGRGVASSSVSTARSATSGVEAASSTMAQSSSSQSVVRSGELRRPASPRMPFSARACRRCCAPARARSGCRGPSRP